MENEEDFTHHSTAALDVEVGPNFFCRIIIIFAIDFCPKLWLKPVVGHHSLVEVICEARIRGIPVELLNRKYIISSNKCI